MPLPHDAYDDLVEKIQATELAIDTLEAERPSPRRDAAVRLLRVELRDAFKSLNRLHAVRAA